MSVEIKTVNKIIAKMCVMPFTRGKVKGISLK